MYMYLRQVSGRGHRAQEPYGSEFNALITTDIVSFGIFVKSHFASATYWSAHPD